MQTATVISHGPAQSVELPEGFEIDGNEVYVKRVGQSVLLIPKDADPWDLMTASLEQITSDFMQDRCQPAQQQRAGSSMKYLLDTNICVFIIRKKSQLALERLRRLSVGDVGISTVTLAELRLRCRQEPKPSR